VLSQQIHDLSDFPTVKGVTGRDNIHRLQVYFHLFPAFPDVYVWRIMIARVHSYVESVLPPIQDRDHCSPHSEYTLQHLALSKTLSLCRAQDVQGYVATKPPSSTSGCPVTKDEASEHSQSTALAISSGAPSLPIGIARCMIAPSAGLAAMPACTIAVSV